MLPARLDEIERTRDPHYYGMGSATSRRRLGGTQLLRPRDVGAQGDQWRSILLDQLRRRGANFFAV